ncbi:MULTISPECIES: DinB family protein [Paenibacillus]|uniref:DinB family protein n=1 Tax=Paenibacillus TaxID=44249 RepID=UPI002FE3CD8A
MNSTKEILLRFESLVDGYIRELDGFTMEQLLQKPEDGGWSLGQMYQHLIQSALYMHLANAETCLRGTADPALAPAGLTKEGNAVFAQGEFPPIRIQVPPSPQYTPKAPESKESLVEGLNRVVVRMGELEPALAGASLRQGVAHPRFGVLTAGEWFALVPMHYRHHLRQLDRLKQELASHA